MKKKVVLPNGDHAMSLHKFFKHLIGEIAKKTKSRIVNERGEVTSQMLRNVLRHFKCRVYFGMERNESHLKRLK